MAFSKAHRYKAEEFLFARLAHLIAHPSRLRILLRLYAEGECNAGDLAEGHPISQQSVSQHLKILREAEVIRCKQEFPTALYRINEDLDPVSKKVIVKFLIQYQSVKGKVSEGALRPVRFEGDLIEGL